MGPLGPNPEQRHFGARFDEICFWKAWEWALLGQILARCLLEPDLANLGLASWLLKFASGNLGNIPSLGQILARSLLEPDFGNLRLASWLLKFASGKLGNGPLWGQILARSLLEPDFAILGLVMWLLKVAS